MDLEKLFRLTLGCWIHIWAQICSIISRFCATRSIWSNSTRSIWS